MADQEKLYPQTVRKLSDAVRNGRYRPLIVVEDGSIPPFPDIPTYHEENRAASSRLSTPPRDTFLYRRKDSVRGIHGQGQFIPVHTSLQGFLSIPAKSTASRTMPALPLQNLPREVHVPEDEPRYENHLD